jgi:hypothetical protein
VPEDGPRADEVPYLVDDCDALNLQFDVEQTSDCPSLHCDCFPPDGLIFPTRRGCVVDLDCAEACSQPHTAFGYLCVQTSCSSDEECPDAGARCLIPPGHDHGLCDDGGDACVQDSDCASDSICVVTEVVGTRRCETRMNGSSCNDDGQCANAKCARPSDSFIGVCSDGRRRDRCFVDHDCGAGLLCLAEFCSDGSYGSTCERDDECASNNCPSGTCLDGRDGDHCTEDSDCRSGICVDDRQSCASGEVDAICGLDSDCKSGLCAYDPFGSACTEGELGSKCVNDADCLAGKCRRGVGFFGKCG